MVTLESACPWSLYIPSQQLRDHLHHEASSCMQKPSNSLELRPHPSSLFDKHQDKLVHTYPPSEEASLNFAELQSDIPHTYAIDYEHRVALSFMQSQSKAQKQRENSITTSSFGKQYDEASYVNHVGNSKEGLLFDSPGQLDKHFDDLSELLKEHGKSKSLSDGRIVHAKVVEWGYDGDTFMANCLVQMYGDCGCLQDAGTAFQKTLHPNQYSWNLLLRAWCQNGSLGDAKSLFHQMPFKDVVSWNGIMGASLQNSCNKDALDLFFEMLQNAIEPSRISFINALDASSRMARLDMGQKVHAMIISSGLDRDDRVGSTLINMHGKCEDLGGAKVVFSKMQECNVISWTAMIAAYARNGHCRDALGLFYTMQAEGIKIDRVTLLSVLTACANLGDLGEGQHIHATILDCKYDQDVSIGNALINMYAKCGDFTKAKCAFEQISKQDVVSWTAFIQACLQFGYDEEAFDMYKKMLCKGIKPNDVTTVCALDACANLGYLKEGKEIHESIGNTYKDNVYLGNALLNMYGKCGLMDTARVIFDTIIQRNVASWNSLMTVYAQNSDMEEALNLFKQMPERDVISWNALISGFVQNGCAKEAVTYSKQMQEEGIQPNKVVFVNLVDASSTLEDPELGMQVHTTVVCTGYEEEGIIQNALINMYGKCGRLTCARFVFDSMDMRNLISWSSMIAAYIQNGQHKEALGLFWEMEQHAVKPDNITCTILLTTCADLTFVEEGQKVHASAIAGDLDVDLAVGNALLSMYARFGSIDSVKVVFSKMYNRDVVSWTTIIVACAKCGESKEALDLFSRMQRDGVKADEVTFIGVLLACCHSGQISDGRRFFSSMVSDHGLVHKSDHYLCMVDLLGRSGHLQEAEDLIHCMPPEKIYLAWLSLLHSCRSHGDVRRGMKAALCCLQMDPKNDAPFTLLLGLLNAWGRQKHRPRMVKLQNLCFEKERVEELVLELVALYDEL